MKNIVHQTSIDLLLKEPFFGHFLTHFKKQVSDKTETIAIDVDDNNELALLINETYWENTLHKADLKKGEIKHQLLHLIFGHLTRSETYQNDDLFGVAADLTINQFINKTELTYDSITLSDFSDIELAPNKTLDFYYKRFLEILIEPKYGNTNARQFLQKALTESHQKLAQHVLWGQTKTNSEQKIVQQKIMEALSTSWQRFEQSNDVGDLPQGLEILIKKRLEQLKPSLNWKRILRLFTNKSRKTVLKNTIRRPSKRYGTTPGTKIEKRQKILIAIDTSASINETLFTQFFDEIYHIWRQNALIHIVECDVDIYRTYDYNGKIPKFVKGKGGTSFNPPIIYANNQFQPDAIIYFTDGKGEKPSTKSRFPILWLIEQKKQLKPYFNFPETLI
ncbi:MAG: VWA-like domain-containing protein [Saprospiraceae bacterium]